MSKVANINNIKSQELIDLVNQFMALTKSYNDINKQLNQVKKSLLAKMDKLGYNKMILNDNYIDLYHIQALNIVDVESYKTLDTDMLKNKYQAIYDECKTKVVASKHYISPVKA